MEEKEEARRGTQGDGAAGPPPEEFRRSIRIAKRHLRAEPRRRRKRMRVMRRKGKGTERPQGGHR